MNGLPARAPALGTAAVLVAIYGIGLYPLLLLGLWWRGRAGCAETGASPVRAGRGARPGRERGAGRPPSAAPPVPRASHPSLAHIAPARSVLSERPRGGRLRGCGSAARGGSRMGTSWPVRHGDHRGVAGGRWRPLSIRHSRRHGGRGGVRGDCAAGRSPAAAGPELRPGGGAGGPPRLSAGAPGTLSDLYTGGLAWEAAPRLPRAGRERDAR